MRSIRRILVAIKDPDARTTPALIKAGQLAHALGAQIELFHGIASPLYVDGYGSSGIELPTIERDGIRADVIQQLMCLGKIDIAAVERRYAIDFLSYFSEALERLRPLVADGLATIVGDYICATPRGRLQLRVIAMCFDRYLQSRGAAEERPRFSKVV